MKPHSNRSKWCAAGLAALIAIYFAAHVVYAIRAARHDAVQLTIRGKLSQMRLIMSNYENSHDGRTAFDDAVERGQSWRSTLYDAIIEAEGGEPYTESVTPSWFLVPDEVAASGLSSFHAVRFQPGEDEPEQRSKWLVVHLPNRRVPWTNPDFMSANDLSTHIENGEVGHFITDTGFLGEITAANRVLMYDRASDVIDALLSETTISE